MDVPVRMTGHERRSYLAWTILAGVLEVEAKVELLAPGALRDRLREAGAQQGALEEHEDVYLGHPTRDFHVTGEAFRLRRCNGTMRLTYKGPRRGTADVKSRQEDEVEVMHDPLPMLEALGFQARLLFHKTREPWSLGDVQVTIDTVEGLGTFAEVEVVSEDEQAAAEMVETALKGLGLEGATRFHSSYLEMAIEAGAPAVRQLE